MNKNIKVVIRKLIAITLIVVSTSSVVACTKSKGEDISKQEQDIAIDDSSNTEKESTTENEDNANVVAEQSGSIITLGDKAFEIFNGNQTGTQKYSETISKHKKELGEDIDVYNMVIPTHVEFGLPKEYKDMSKSQKSSIDNIYKGMDKDVKTVDIYNKLKQHKDEYIYFNTDHHWTTLGAYYAYEEFCKVAGLDSIDINKYEKYTIEDFLGTFYTQTQDNNLKKNPDKVDYYKIPENYKVYRYEKENLDKPLKTTLYADYASGTNSYSVFLHGDFPMIKIENKKESLDKK